ncbi:MAG: dTDP-4-dehydrorhamnose reductase [Acidobacteriota bacterium]
MGGIYQVAVLGGKGMLGTDLNEVLMSRGLVPTIYDLPNLDIQNKKQLAMVLDEADAVVNCAAYTNVDGAESNVEAAYRVNAEAVGNLGELAAARNVPVLHISTDFVFDGEGDRPYTEEDAVGPLGVYGASKLKGEQLLAESGCRYCTVRVEWTYGRAGNNFIAKILERARNEQPIKVVDDQIGAPTSTRQVALALAELLQHPDGMAEGLFHFAAAGYTSRFEVARFVIEKTGLDAQLIPCKTSDFPSPARRPLNSRFDCRKISRFLAEPIQPWQVPLERYLEKER